MKKLMIAAAIVCAAALAQASSYTWKVGSAVYLPDQSSTPYTKVADNTVAYLFDANQFSRQQLLTAFTTDAANFNLATVWGTSGVTTAPNTAAASGKFAQSAEFTYNVEPADTAWGAYYALVQDGKLFISSEKSVTASDLSTAVPIAMNNDGANSIKATITTGTLATGGAAGWYGAAAVPEPTSGLLLLLGVAGLALRRRRA